VANPAVTIFIQDVTASGIWELFPPCLVTSVVGYGPEVADNAAMGTKPRSDIHSKSWLAGAA
jgi:hypothetical protein